MNIFATPKSHEETVRLELAITTVLGAIAAGGLALSHTSPEDVSANITCDKVTYTSQSNGSYLVDVDWSSVNDGEPTKLTITYPTSPKGILARLDSHPITQPETLYTIQPVFGSGDTAANSIQVSLHDKLGHTSLCSNVRVN